MSATEIKALRQEVRREIEPVTGAIIRTIDKQAAAIEHLSIDCREAFQQQNDKIRDLIAAVDRAELRIHRLEHPNDVA